MSDHFFGIDPGVIGQLLPLGDSILGTAVTLLTALITYGVGRSRAKAEVDKIYSEKKAIEAASGVSTAEAAQIISEASAAVVQPLLDRIRQQREELMHYSERHIYYLNEIEKVRTERARIDSENALLKRHLILLGETIPTLPPEVK